MNRYLFLLLILGRGLFLLAEDAPIVREIVLQHQGSPAAADSYIRAHIRTAVGQPYSVFNIDFDIKKLSELELFANIEVRTEALTQGVRVIYVLTPKARIRDVLITGNKKLKRDSLLKLLLIKTGDVLDGSKIEQSVKKLLTYYQKQGYQQAKVTHEEAISPESAQAVVTFHVEEGLQVRIESVDFKGNHLFTTKQLRRQIRTKGASWYSFFMRNNRVREELIEEDKERLREFYFSRGYVDMEIKDFHIESIHPDLVKITLTLFEGKLYKIGQIQIQGNQKFGAAALLAKCEMGLGKTFTPGGIGKDVQALRDFYGTKGYIDTRIVPDQSPNVETGRMDISYRIDEGEISHIEKIEIRGNVKTKDKVIRRELAVRPGQVFDMVKVHRSQERLQNLNYFTKVNIEPEPTDSESRKNMVVEVDEKQTGSVSFGAGAGSVEQVFGFVELQESNFDLFNPPRFGGGGQRMRLRAQLGTVSQYYLLSFTEPWFLNQKLSLGFDLFRDKQSFVSSVYNLQQQGGDLKLAKSLDGFTTGEIKYEYKKVTIGNVPLSASNDIRLEEGTRTESSFTLSLRRDTRNNVFIPTRGYRTDLTAQVASSYLGGDTNLYKLEGHQTFFFPLWAKHVLSLKLSAGTVESYSGGESVPLFDRYFLGGPNDMRGYKFHAIAPKDPITLDTLGGNTFAQGTIEYTIPVVNLPKAGVRLAAFYDVGNVWKSSWTFHGLSELNDDVGLGLRLDLYNIPIRIDYAFPLRHQENTGAGGRINFSLGYQF